MNLHNFRKRVKLSITILLLLLASLPGMTQGLGEGLAGLEIIKADTRTVLGTNVGFYVEFQNNNHKGFDALEYLVTYYDGFDEQVGEKDFKWQPASMGKCIESGKVLKDFRANWIKGANKIHIKITRVHFIDGTIVDAGKDRKKSNSKSL